VFAVRVWVCACGSGGSFQALPGEFSSEAVRERQDAHSLLLWQLPLVCIQGAGHSCRCPLPWWLCVVNSRCFGIFKLIKTQLLLYHIYKLYNFYKIIQAFCLHFKKITGVRMILIHVILFFLNIYEHFFLTKLKLFTNTLNN